VARHGAAGARRIAGAGRPTGTRRWRGGVGWGRDRARWGRDRAR